MTDSNDSYVHDPESFREQTDHDEPDRTTKAYFDSPEDGRSDQTFGRHGWLLVGTLAIAFVVAPATILYLPHADSVITPLGLSFRDAYLVVPLIPALALGTVAVWTAVHDV
ncbi:hypothetical protein [Halocatena pleomorpha]|uniref:Uncharacterized protein n=1 Tax=Halocatena pleomorpha TaxID=1785090 RepID=A0A3P3RAJ4_9EURY|nr:hypothetical protein [Halocatena pleomorpha]RRJ30512.1 hypothetical protein EIK79_09505 [Halocatena pleomorpha]